MLGHNRDEGAMFLPQFLNHPDRMREVDDTFDVLGPVLLLAMDEQVPNAPNHSLSLDKWGVPSPFQTISVGDRRGLGRRQHLPQPLHAGGARQLHRRQRCGDRAHDGRRALHGAGPHGSGGIESLRGEAALLLHVQVRKPGRPHHPFSSPFPTSI